MKTMYVKIPDKLTENDVAAEYGMDALRLSASFIPICADATAAEWRLK